MTLELGLNPEYILDRAEFYEICALMKSNYKKHKDLWEAARLISFVVAQCHSYKKKLQLHDIVTFPWEADDENTMGGTKPMTQEQFDDTFALMEEMLAQGLI